MSARLEELDWRTTPMGEITLRRRREPTLDVDVYEVRLGDEFLMSSLFTVAEVELARLGLAAVPEPGTDSNDAGPDGSALDVVALDVVALDVVVGGLGLGYTARAALEDPRVTSLHVIEALDVVIDWQQRHLLPHSHALTEDPRCHLVEQDFFAAVAGHGFGPDTPQRWHAILLDIDHTPQHVLHPSHAAFYSEAGLRRVVDLLHPGGVFALWSDDPPEEGFLALLRQVFVSVEAHVVTFANHYSHGQSANTVYVARRD